MAFDAWQAVKTLVDANVLLDVITQDKAWASWSEAALRKAAEHSALTINPIIFAEVSTKFDRIEYADAALVASLASRCHTRPGSSPKSVSRLQEAGRDEALTDAGFST